MHKCKYIKWLQGVSPTENVNYIKSGSYEEKENGQTADFDNLSALAPQLGLEPRTL